MLEVETLFQPPIRGKSFLSGKALRVSLGALADFPPAIAEFNRLGRHPHGASIAPEARLCASQPEPVLRAAWREVPRRTSRRCRFTSGRSRGRARDLYLDLKLSERMSREELDELQLTKLQAARPARVHARSLLPRGLRRSRRAPGGHPKRQRSRIAAPPREGRRPQEVALRALLGQPQEAGHASRRDERLDRRAVRDVRRQVPARDALCDDPARARVDGVALRRPAGATLAPNPRHEQVADRTRADRRVVHAPALHSGLRDRARHDRGLCPSGSVAIEPVLVDGYAESLNFLATYVREGGDPAFSPKAMMSSAQSLTDDVRDLDRGGISDPRLRQVRQPRVLGNRLHVRGLAGPSRDGRELRRGAPRRRSSGAARRDRRGRGHRSQQLLRPAHPLPDRRPRGGRRPLGAVPVRKALSAASGGSKGGRRRSSIARTEPGSPGRSSCTSSRSTSTRSGSSRSTSRRRARSPCAS